MELQLQKTIKKIEDVLYIRYHLDKVDLEDKFLEWKRTNFGKNKSQFYLTVLRSLLYELPLRNSDDKEKELNEMIASLMILEGENVTEVTAEINRIEIDSNCWGSNMEPEFEIIPADNCNYSKQFKNVVFDCNENLPLDYSKCERKFGCLCKVVMRPKRDSEGRIIIRWY